MMQSLSEFPQRNTGEVRPTSVRDTAEQGVYTALLATAGFIIVGLLRVAERRDDRLR